MDKRCILFKCLMVIVSFFFLLDNRLAISIAVDRYKKDNHTIKDSRKIHDQKASASRFNFRMHNGGLHSLFDSGTDQMKTLYTNLGSANNQVQLKYITGQGLLSPLIIRASDLGLGPEQAQLHGLPDFLNDFNNLNQPNGNQFMMRPIKHHQNDHLFQGPLSDLFSDGLMKRPPRRGKKKRKKEQIFKFNSEQEDSMKDSMEFGKSNSMEFNQHNSMEFPMMNNSPPKKSKHNNFEKSYDELVNSAKKLADTIENSSDNNDDGNTENDGKDKKSTSNFESDKFSFDDEMKLSQKDEDELDNLEKIENVSGFGDGMSGSVQGNKKNMNSDSFKDDFESIEKNAFTSSTDNDKFSELFSNDKFSDLFNEKLNSNDENEEDHYDKMYDKIINKINGKDKKNEKFSNFNENLFEDKKTIKKGTKKKAADEDTTSGDTGQFANENTSDEVTNKDQDDAKINNENEQTEYNTNNSGHTETGEYDYAGYAKDPNEQSEEITDNDADKNPDKGIDKAPNDTGNYNSNGKYQDEAGASDGKYQDEQTATSPPTTPDNAPENYKDQPQSTTGVTDERSFKSVRSNQPFTRLKVKNNQNAAKKLNAPLNHHLKSNNKNSNKQVLRVRSKRIHHPNHRTH